MSSFHLRIANLLPQKRKKEKKKEERKLIFFNIFLLDKIRLPKNFAESDIDNESESNYGKNTCVGFWFFLIIVRTSWTHQIEGIITLILWEIFRKIW